MNAVELRSSNASELKRLEVCSIGNLNSSEDETCNLDWRQLQSKVVDRLRCPRRLDNRVVRVFAASISKTEAEHTTEPKPENSDTVPGHRRQCACVFLAGGLAGHCVQIFLDTLCRICPGVG